MRLVAQWGVSMKKVFFSVVALCISLASIADPIGEVASYILNDSNDRTSWLIRDGEGQSSVVELREDPKLGPVYLVNIEYSFDVLFAGNHNGVIGLLVPVTMFEEQFYEDLKTTHPVNMGSFKVDYLGMARGRDNENNTYDQCMKIRLFDVDQNYRPIRTEPRVHIISHESTGSLNDVENLVLNFKKHATIPVLGAVEIDISGKARGIDFRVGLDFVVQP